MSRVIKTVFNVFWQGVSLLLSPLMLCFVMIKLGLNASRLKKIQVAVVMKEGGVGHTATGPDITRRLFKDQACAFIILSEWKRHNRKLAEMWSDIFVLFLPLNFGVGSLPLYCFPWSKNAAFNLVCWALRRRKGRQVFSMQDIYKKIAIGEYGQDASEDIRKNYLWGAGYFDLIESTPAASVRLPQNKREEMARKLDQMASGNASRRCCLYLRQKGSEWLEKTSTLRDGSGLEFYVPAIQHLIRAGYQVLMTGDIEASDSFLGECGGLLADAKSLGVNSEWFSLYAATESDIFIGEAGGGSWFPPMNGMRQLLINAFPYYLGVPRGQTYYKTVRDASGTLVNYRKLFAEHAYDYDLPGMQVCNNSAEEIMKAVASFLEEEPSAPLESIPETTLCRYGKGGLSPVWLRLYSEHNLEVYRKGNEDNGK